MNLNELNHTQCSYVKCVMQCLILSIIYVSSLYVWNSQHSRDHPSTIKKRFLSVSFMLIFSPLYTWYFIHDKTKVSYAENIKSNLTDLIWLRNYVVAPISEEFTFRACIIPLLLQCFQPLTTILICPVFFGAAHFNQWIERMRAGTPCFEAFLMSLFQFGYTTIFGAYSALLFICTGNIIAPIVAHKFCNHMGFPDFPEMLRFSEPKRSCLFILSLVGLILWCIAIKYATDPRIYSNQMDWTEMNQCNATKLWRQL